MLYCKPDAMGIVAEIATRRADMVIKKALKLNQHEKVHIPDETIEGLRLVNRLHRRFVEGDYRMTTYEWGIVKHVGHFLYHLHCKNNAQPVNALNLDRFDEFWQMVPAPPMTYRRVVKGLQKM